jgi:putative ATPase
VGQSHILGHDKLLFRLIEDDRVPSLILWGPPGTGKTTIAKLIARKTHARFESLSAVLSGVADLRKVLAEARRLRGERGERTILFVDEIHRWSKSQQDALLEAVERGVVTLIGATTENPSFELNAALLSRTRVFVLEQIGEEDLILLLRRALSDRERGLGKEQLDVTGDALSVIARGAWGDARRALSVLEIAARDALLLTDRRPAPVTPEMAEEALQHRTLLYDKAGDEHYGVISAFIKSMRGSDPDAAAYYLVRMLESGEDPRFLLRRMVIFASEDVGNADPQALGVAVNALQAFELVGLPEGVLPLTQCATYLASAPKSNSALTTYSAARKAIVETGPLPVPAKLLNAVTGLAKKMGHGGGYKYPHDLGGLAPGETYLPDELAGHRFYEPSKNGAEAEIKARVDAWRSLTANANSGKRA